MTAATSTAPGRERVLREAMRLFGERGFAGTSVRLIASAADVSPANVIHHFGTKEQLRAEVDALLLSGYADVLRATAQALLGGSGEQLPDVTAVGGGPAVRGYLRRALLDGGAASSTLVRGITGIVRDELTSLCEQGRTRPGADLDYGAVQVVALLVGPVVLGPLLPGFEDATSAPGTLAHRARADVDLLREGLLRP